MIHPLSLSRSGHDGVTNAALKQHKQQRSKIKTTTPGRGVGGSSTPYSTPCVNANAARGPHCFKPTHPTSLSSSSSSPASGPARRISPPTPCCHPAEGALPSVPKGPRQEASARRGSSLPSRLDGPPQRQQDNNREIRGALLCTLHSAAPHGRYAALPLRRQAQHHVDALHDVVLLGVVGLVLAGDLQHGGNGTRVLVQHLRGERAG